MPELTIDGKSVEVAEGSTVLQAAEQAGAEVPTLCNAPEVRPLTSCMVCVVKETVTGRTLPACSAKAEDGMVIETASEEVRSARREVLQLLLSEHVGDCEAPCRRTCAASTDIPLMLREIAKGDMAAAARIARRDLVLPATLGWVCAAPCEKTCRRGAYDEAISIRELHRRAAEEALENGLEPPDGDPATGKRVAVVGAGPAGLAAATVLRRLGHDCHVFEKADKPGGRFRKLPEDELPKRVLDDEIELLRKMGVTFETSCEIGVARPLKQLREEYDAVIVTAGEHDADDAGGLFVAKTAPAPVRAVANGKAAAEQADCSFRSGASCGNSELYDSRIGRLDSETLERYVINRVDQVSLARPRDGGRPQEEAARCLHCDCRTPVSCKLRRYATTYGAKPGARGTFERPPLQIVQRCAGVLFESGKCIRCGLCVEITRSAGEELGLTFVNRGFDVRVAVPLGGTLEQGLRISAQRCVEACPTGALTFPDQEERKQCE
jgi:ferredoxin